jgi:hypothetical protein
MKDFFNFVQQNADRLCDLPNKFIDTNMILLAQLILCLSVYSATLYLQSVVVNSCLAPVYPIPSKTK